MLAVPHVPTVNAGFLLKTIASFFAGAAVGAAAFSAAWKFLIPPFALRPELADDRSLAAYYLLFSFHILNALTDHCTGAFRDARRWQELEWPPHSEFRQLWSFYLAFWITTHSPCAVAASWYFAKWSLVDAEGLQADVILRPVSVVLAQPVPDDVTDAALRAVSAAGIASLALYAARAGVVVLPPSAPRIGLRRLTDQPLWAVLTLVCAVEAARAAAAGVALADSRVAVPLLVACWTLIGGTHQNARYTHRASRSF